VIEKPAAEPKKDKKDKQKAEKEVKADGDSAA
jgi:hypothetical protein